MCEIYAYGALILTNSFIYISWTDANRTLKWNLACLLDKTWMFYSNGSCSSCIVAFSMHTPYKHWQEHYFFHYVYYRLFHYGVRIHSFFRFASIKRSQLFYLFLITCCDERAFQASTRISSCKMSRDWFLINSKGLSFQRFPSIKS